MERRRLLQHAPRLLVVEGHPLDTELCLEILRGAGYTAVAAAGVPEARMALAATRPDPILLDGHPPEVPGGVLLTELSAQDRPPPVVVTADASAELRGEALAGGAAAVATKPYLAADLLATVRRALEGEACE